jgi:hypothetical protein
VLMELRHRREGHNGWVEDVPGADAASSP